MKNESLFTTSKELGMATSYLSGIENGRVEPTDKDLIKISAYLAGANFEVEYERIKENRARFEQFMELLQGENNSDESDPVTKVTNAVLNGGVDAEGIKTALHILPLLAKSEVTKDTETAKGKSTPIKSVLMYHEILMKQVKSYLRLLVLFKLRIRLMVQSLLHLKITGVLVS